MVVSDIAVFVLKRDVKLQPANQPTNLSMAYLLSNTCTKNYWNRTSIVEIIVGVWVVSFFETQCILILPEVSEKSSTYESGR